MPFDVLSPNVFDELFIVFWLLACLVILVVGVLMILCIVAVCYKIVVAKFAPRQPRNKTARQTKARRRAQRAHDVQAKHRIKQPHRPMIPEVRYFLLGL